MNEMEEIKTAKEASISKVRDAGRSLIVTEGDLYTLLEAGRHESMVDVKRLAAKVVVMGAKEYEQMLLAGKSDSGPVNLSADEQGWIKEAVIAAAVNGNPIVGLAASLAREFKEVKGTWRY